MNTLIDETTWRGPTRVGKFLKPNDHSRYKNLQRYEPILMLIRGCLAVLFILVLSFFAVLLCIAELTFQSYKQMKRLNRMIAK